MKENSSFIYFLSHPIQYVTPVLQELSKETILEVFYYSDISIKGGIDKGFGENVVWDLPLLEGYKSSFLKNLSKSGAMDCRFGDAINPGVWKVMLNSKSKVVLINSWTYGTDLFVIFTAWIFGKKVWLRAENPLNQELLKSGWKQKVKYYFLKFFVFKFFINKFLFIGSENKKFFQYYGVLESNLIYTPYAVDNYKFKGEFEIYKKDKASLKNELGIPSTSKVILFSGKYIDKKRPLDLLKAFELLKNKELTLVFMGDGPLRKEMEKYVFESKLENVVLTGFINQSNISKYYSIADVFVMCSGIGETWGLSVNEAMNFKLPVIVSNTTGSSFDLVKQGQNGFVFKEGDILGLNNYLKIAFSPDFNLAEAGEISSLIIEDFSIQKIVRNITTGLIR